jgi:hypothetical protein
MAAVESMECVGAEESQRTWRLSPSDEQSPPWRVVFSYRGAFEHAADNSHCISH